MDILIIGAGKVVSGYDSPSSTICLTHIHAILNVMPGASLTIVDNDINALAQLEKKWAIEFQSYRSVHELPSNKVFDVALIACPTSFHFRILMDILTRELSRLIICEKPCTSSLPEIEQVISLSSLKSIPVYVNYQRRLEKTWQKVACGYSNKDFGRFQVGNVLYSKGLINYASHALNILEFILGPLSFHSVYGRLFDYSEYDLTYNFAIKVKGEPNSLITFLGCNNNCFTIFEIDLLFEKARIRYDDFSRQIAFYVIEDDPHYTDQVSLASQTVDNAFSEPFMHLWNFVCHQDFNHLEPLLIQNAYSTYILLHHVQCGS
jgi:predicted dehydrogenase